MATSKTLKGPTPNGGVKSVLYYMDDSGDPIDESQATQGEEIEFDANGEMVSSTWVSLKPIQKKAQSEETS